MSREVGRSADLAKRAAAAAARCAAWNAATTAGRIREGRSVCGVECLGAELEVEALRELEGSENRRIHIEQVRPVKHVSGRGAEALSVHSGKTARVKPVLPIAHHLWRTDGTADAVRILVVAGGIERTAAGTHAYRSV